MRNFLFIVFIFLSAVRTEAQEIQAPLDEEGKLEIIDSKLENKLGLFREYKGLKEVKLFQNSDTSFVLEVLYQPENEILKIRKPLSQKEVQDLRRQVTASLQEQAPEILLDQEGRTRLLVGTSLVSLGFYGWTIPYILEVREPSVSAGINMLTGGAGFFIPYAALRNTRTTEADATMCIYGQTRGILHGASLRLFIDEEATTRQVLGTGMLISLAEGIGGYIWADRTQMTDGTASAIGAAGDFGMGVGLGTAHFTGLLDDLNARRITASMLAGSAAGIGAGVSLAKNQSYTRGDAVVLRGAGILGAYVTLVPVLIANPENAKTYSGAATLGSIGGIAIGHRLAKGNNFTTEQGIQICLAEVAGGLVGLGTGYLFSHDTDESYKFLAVTSALGAVGGFALMASIYSKKEQVENKAYSVDFNINPYGILGLSKDNMQKINQMSLPAFSARIRF